MNSLMIGKTRIEYEVRFSPRARRQRIVVTPGKVEVIAPEGRDDTPDGAIEHPESNGREAAL